MFREAGYWVREVDFCQRGCFLGQSGQLLSERPVIGS